MLNHFKGASLVKKCRIVKQTDIFKVKLIETGHKKIKKKKQNVI